MRITDALKPVTDVPVWLREKRKKFNEQNPTA